MPSLGGWELVILIGILVLLFGAKRLPDMARSIGQSARVFKGEMKGLEKDGAAASSTAASSTAANSTAVDDAPVQAPEPTRTGQGPGGTGL